MSDIDREWVRAYGVAQCFDLDDAEAMLVAFRAELDAKHAAELAALKAERDAAVAKVLELKDRVLEVESERDEWCRRAESAGTLRERELEAQIRKMHDREVVSREAAYALVERELRERGAREVQLLDADFGEVVVFCDGEAQVEAGTGATLIDAVNALVKP